MKRLTTIKRQENNETASLLVKVMSEEDTDTLSSYEVLEQIAYY